MVISEQNFFHFFYNRSLHLENMTLAVITFLFTILSCNCVQYCYARDNITTGDRMRDPDGDILVSAGNKFQLGFFSPNGNSNKGLRYIGIWYYMINRTKTNPRIVVWVCNRDTPVVGGSGVFRFDGRDGDLKLENSTDLFFSTGLNSSSGSQANSSRTAKLLDNGNLVLTDDQTGHRLWQSFDNPTDTFLPGMKMDENLKLTAWISVDNPAKGDYTFQNDQEDDDGGYVITKKARTYWKSGGESSGDRHLLGYPNKMNQFAALLLSNNYSHGFSGSFGYSRLVMHFSGEIQYLISWDRRWWFLNWSEPQGPCSVYNTCGDFSICNSSDRKNCKCFRGFIKADEGKTTNFSSGCNRKSDLCSLSKQDTQFFNVNVIKVAPPKTKRAFDAKNETECRGECLEDCRCQAYYYRNRSGSTIDTPDNTNACWTWREDLTDIQDGYVDGGNGYNLSIKIASSDYDQVRNPGPVQSGGMQPKKKKSRPSIVVIIPTSLIVAVILFCSISYFCYRRVMTKRKDQSTQQQNPVLHLYDGERLVKNLIDQDDDQFREDDKKDIDVPFFHLENILAATDNFSQANKLGQGGFGPVYKGKFPGGEEIAVKRLSSNSVQGLKEFKNEVVLIAKLQHRNLVRLLGYCIEGNEKILLYEYMQNKSLDAFIFDEKLCMLLDWKRRFDIILGVARGLLYLHQDSRLRIIHRDMKTSNILLDEEMNPKISDFGLARIVGGRETEANTKKVVGTYGYMSPEYALDGQFSVKSDAFSFGVVVLEIICGKRNTGFYESQLNWNLLGYAWNLWKEEKPLALLDETLVESCNEREVLKCIIIGLLCVQEDPGDRPTMSKVLFMLNSEMEMLPNPKQPAFISRKRLSGTSSSSSAKPEALSKNEITVSLVEGR